MARKPARKIPKIQKAPGGFTTLPVSEEGIPQFQQIATTFVAGEEGPSHLTTFVVGEENPIHTTVHVGEEGPTLFLAEHPSLVVAENSPSTITAEFGPITDPGGPVEAQAIKAKARRRKK